MGGVLEGLATVVLLILAGYVASRARVIRASDRLVLNRVSFYVATPALLYTILARADLSSVLSPVLLVVALAGKVSFLVCVAASRRWFRRDGTETVLLGASAGYVNATALGLPIAIFVIGDGALAAALALLQMLFVVPALLVVLECSRGGGQDPSRLAVRTVLNPVCLGALAGILASSFAFETPRIVLVPLDALGASAIPLILLSFGASLHGQPVPGRGRRAFPVLTASALKLVLMPLAAWVVSGLFQLDPSQALAAVTLATLPTAQNLYTFAAAYERGDGVVRDVVVVTTIGAIPVILVVQWLLS